VVLITIIVKTFRDHFFRAHRSITSIVFIASHLGKERKQKRGRRIQHPRLQCSRRSAHPFTASSKH